MGCVDRATIIRGVKLSCSAVAGDAAGLGFLIGCEVLAIEVKAEAEAEDDFGLSGETNSKGPKINSGALDKTRVIARPLTLDDIANSQN